jgi:hypothetical protein
VINYHPAVLLSDAKKRVEEIIGTLMIKFIQSRSYPIREDFRNAVYQAIID